MTMHPRPILLAATVIAMPLASALAQGYPVGNYAGNQPPAGSAMPTTAPPEANTGGALVNPASPAAAPTGNYAPRRAIAPGANGQIAGNQAKSDQARSDTVRNGSL